MQIAEFHQLSKNYKKPSPLVHFAFICLLTYSFFCLLPTRTNAEGINISVAPAILQIEAIPPADARAPFIVENKSDEPITLKIGYKLFRASDKGDGQIEFLKDTDPFPGANQNIFEQIEVIDDNFSIDSLELGPKQKKKLNLRIIAPKKEPFSDYYFSLIFLTESPHEEEKEDSKSKEKASTSTATGGVAINVLLSIGPKDNPKGYIEEFSTPWYRESGPVPFNLKVKNVGKHFITPKGTILIKNMFGQTVGKIDIAQSNILAGTTRSLTDTKQNSSNLYPNPTVVWPDTFLLGFYTASLTLSISDNGPIYNNSIYFTAFPVRLLIGIVIAIIIIILAYMRIRKKISEK